MARGRKPSDIKKNNKPFKLGNGKGSVYKLSGNRRKPWVAAAPAKIEYNKETNKARTVQHIIGYYSTEDEANYARIEYLNDPYDLSVSKNFFEIYEMWSERYYAELKNDSSRRTCISAYNHSTPLYDRDIESINITMLRDTINNADVGESTKSRMKSLYNLMWDFAVEAQYCKINIARQFTIKNQQKKIEKDRKHKVNISSEHKELLWNNPDFGYVKMILIGIYTGFRPHELCILEISNVHLDENYIIGGEKTEAGEDRYVPIHPRIKPLIEYYYNKNKDLKYLFLDENNLFMTYDKYRGRFKKAMTYINAVGLYSPHCTRHTFITDAKEARLDNFALKLIVGHEIDDVTEKVYTHRNNEAFLQEEILKLK